ncbi:DUF4422 domain-containing protein [Campylobacter jejuni]|nr:DUF4422 domain-containing protein [Campylobacter jejuni]
MTKETKTPKVKILVGYHKPAVLLKNDILTPIHLGRALATQASKDGEMSKEDFEWMCENMIGDDTGDNISHLNRYFCELTGIYWAWKNYDKLGNPDYIGFMHYRRHFIQDQFCNLFNISGPENYFYHIGKYDLYYNDIVRKLFLDEIIYDLIIPKIYNVNNNVFHKKTIYDDFSGYCDYPEVLIDFEKIIKKHFKEYSSFANNYYKQNSYYFCNMFIMKKELFFDYCNFIFNVIFVIYDGYKYNIEKNNRVQSQRTLAWLSEHITSIFYRKQIENKIKFKTMNVSLVNYIDNPNISRILKYQNLLASSEIQTISFDIFDTLLIRPYSTPQDVFLHLEEKYNLKGFAKDRIEAENKACILLNKKLVNYDEIYEYMPQIYQILKEKEQELEFNTLYVNTEMKVIYDYLIKQGKKIILTSDMYYSEDFFKQLLDKNGIKGYYKIYISGVIKKSKHHGDLYQHIIDDLKINANNIIHIGDNYYADYQKAINNGLQALHYEAPIMQFFNAFPRLKNFYDENNNLTSHIIIGLLLKKWIQSNKNIENYWEYFGYFYGGPICYGLSKFVYDEAIKENLKEFIFAARDGYTIEKIFNLLQKQYNTNIKTAYVYAPRALHLQINLDYFSEYLYQTRASSLINLYKNYIDNFNEINKLSEKEKEFFIKNNIFDFQDISKEILVLFDKYIKSFKFKEKKIGIFDLATDSFSSIKLLKRVLRHKALYGYFWYCGDKYKNKFLYKKYNYENIQLLNYELPEFIITAPELPIQSINNNGEFIRINNSHENKRAEIYKIISNEEIKFSQDLLSIFKDIQVSFENKTLINFLNIFISTLDENDRYFFNDIYHGMSEDHSVYRKLFIDNMQINNQANAVGAVEKVKTHLSYKLGKEILSIKENKLKVLILPFALIFVYIKHKISNLIFKLILISNPNLKSLPLNHYSDYQEALKIQNYLSYKLGNLLIKHPFTFVFRVARVYKEWKENK